MRGKLLFVAGIAAGYVIGARAGRPAYEALATRVQGFRENPTVLKAGGKAKEALEDKAPKVADTVSKAAETAAGAASAASSASDTDADASDAKTASTTSDSAKTSGQAKSGAPSGAEASSAPGSEA